MKPVGKTSHRSERLADEVRASMARAVSRMSDPRLGFVTVTEVQLSPDLRHARVAVSILGDEEQQKKSLAALDSARTFLRRELAHDVRLRYIPELSFALDRGLEQAARVEELLRRAQKKK